MTGPDRGAGDRAGDPSGVYVFRMPSLGADMESGKLVEWLVSVGDRVERGDIVAVVDTEKADIEVEIFATGVVTELLVKVGETLPVGTPMARVQTFATGRELAAERPAAVGAEVAAPAAAPPAARRTPAATSAPVAGPVRAPAAPAGRRVSPAARRRAEEHGIDLDTVTGSGPDGAVVLRDVEQAERAPAVAVHRHVHPVARKMAHDLGVDLGRVEGTGIGHAVTKADVERAARQGMATPGPSARAQPARRGSRRALAAAMSRANRDIPHYYLGMDIELSTALAWLKETNETRPVTERLLPAALLLAAVARAAGEISEMNGFWTDGAFHSAERVHLGVAVSRRDGEVVVPAIHDADRLALGDLMAALRDLVKRARAGSLRSSEVVDATLTVTNLGDLGADAVHGVIYPPQVALVGFGRIRDRPWVVNGELVVRPVVTATLAADHRASDGYAGGRFLARIADLLADAGPLAVSMGRGQGPGSAF